MRWSRKRSLAAPLPYLTFRPTYPRTSERPATRTTMTMSTMTTKEEDHEERTRRTEIATSATPRVDLSAKGNKLLYLWKYTSSNEGGIGVVFTEVGPLERRLRSTDDSFFEESAERERERERERETFVPLDRRSALHHACTAPIRSDGCDRAVRKKVSGSARSISSGFSPGWNSTCAGVSRVAVSCTVLFLFLSLGKVW